MTIAITGGSGFIGTVLARRLAASGQAFKILDIAPSKEFPEHVEFVDVRDAPALERALKGCGLVYHLAAEHKDDVSPVSLYYSVNVDGAKNLVAAAEKNGIEQIIFSSTVALYGLNNGDSKETSTPSPFNDYGQSKLESEKVFEDWALKDPARKLVMMRLVATFGIGNRGNIYNLIAQVVRGKFLMVGRGKNKKSLAYVENVAAFLEYCQGFGPGVSIYNYVDKPDYTMNELVADISAAAERKSSALRIPYIVGLLGGACFDLLAALSGRTFPISLVRVRKFCADTVVNADKVQASGFCAPYTMKEGLGTTIRGDVF
ncbi:MAG: NAD-dependent epimerase/dehydratase family protein [Rhodospirillales bacterium]|nr:NAD-dependent epimerase/dehydratase family protein [Rhodospirillales bacterium]